MNNDIQLKPVKEEHLELIRTWRQSEEVSKFMYTAPEISADEQRAWYEKISNDPAKEYYIISYNDKNLGLASITDIDTLFSKCSWAFYLGDTSVRGKGIGSKVEYRIISHVFENLKLNRLECEVLATNEKVVEMHQKFGFVKEGYFRQYVIKDGVAMDVISLALLKDDWMKIRQSLHDKIYRHD